MAPDSPYFEYLQFARSLADAAGLATLAGFRRPVRIDNKWTTGFDPVTAADKAAERAMRRLIQQRYPQHGILGEEEERAVGSSNFTWVLDPIDGTRSYILGTPLWGTLIALNDGSRPVLGLMDQPFTRERFEGDGRGAWLNGAELRTRPCPALSEARLMSSSPGMFATPAEQQAFSAVAGQAQILRYGAACYAYCMLAAGHVDAVVEAGLQPYDIQALIPIIEGAGGIITTWNDGDAQHGGNIVACGDRRLHAEILGMLQGG